jgi:hydrogenase nickel incorporation protein HypA/HybF
MHEGSITQAMLNLALKHAERHYATRLVRINLAIGEVSGVVDIHVQLYFDFLSKGTIAEGAHLSFRTVPATGRCRNCGREFKLQGLACDWVCPVCGGTQVQIIGGNRLYLESIEVA